MENPGRFQSEQSLDVPDLKRDWVPAVIHSVRQGLGRGRAVGDQEDSDSVQALCKTFLHRARHVVGLNGFCYLPTESLPHFAQVAQRALRLRGELSGGDCWTR